MAKAQGLGFVDAHIEKIVLAACLLVLVYVVVRYGVSTPRRLDAVNSRGAAEEVLPSEIDATLQNAARQLNSRIEKEKLPSPRPRTDLAKLKEQQKNPLLGIKFRMNFGPPTAKGITSEGISQAEPPTLAEIIDAMPAPAKPVQWMGEELIGKTDENREISFSEDPAWHAVTYYPWNELIQAWEKELKNTVVPVSPVAFGYELEIQEKQASGQWKTVDSIKPYSTDEEADQQQQLPEIPAFTGDNAVVVRGAKDNYENDWMFFQLQPDYVEIWTSQGQQSWEQSLPIEDILKVFPKDDEKDNEKKDIRKKPDRRKPINPRLRAGAAAAMPPRMPEPRMIGPEMMPRANAGRLSVAKPARRLQRNRKIETEGVLSLPGPDRQLAAGKLLAWFHTRDIKFGTEYRCRFRMVLINPLLSYSSSVSKDKPEDAITPFVKTKFSPWSDPVAVYRAVEFFITRGKPDNKMVVVTIFAKSMGQRVQRRSSKLTVGNKIEESGTVTVINPSTRELEEISLDFDTGAIALEINFNKRYVNSAGFVKQDGVELVYLDAKGRLRSKFLHNDKKSIRYKELGSEAAKTRAEVSNVENPDRESSAERRRRLKEEKRQKRQQKGRPGGMPDMPGMPPR